LRPYVEPASSFRQKVDHPSSSQSSNPAPFASRGGFASTGSYANPVEERFGIDSLLTACVSRMSGAARRLLIFDVVQAVCRQAKKKCEGGTPCRRVSGPRSCVLARRWHTVVQCVKKGQGDSCQRTERLKDMPSSMAAFQF
jgi:hypothetical protein